MATQTTKKSPEATPEQTEQLSKLLATRETAIQGWTEADTNLAQAQADEQSAPKPSAARALARKRRLSHGAKKANRRAEIRDAETDLRLAEMDGEIAQGSWTPWIEPAPRPRPGVKSRLLPMTQAEIEEKLAKVRKLQAALTDDDAKHGCEIRIKALLKSAEARGYTVS